MQIAPVRTASDIDPADAFMRRYGQDLMAMPGIAGVKWDRTLPGQVTVTFADDGFRALADNVLRDTVDGARLVLASITSGQPGAELPWWSNSFNQMQNAVRAMPGVVNSSQIMEHGLRDVLFDTANKDVAARLRALVNPQLGDWRVTFLPAG